MKRVMASFISADAGKPKHQQKQQPKSDLAGGASVAFMSPNMKSKESWPVCHA
jgi:hypothetical protein